MERLGELTYNDVHFFSFAGLKTIGKVAHIIDGDTAHIILLDRQGEPIKLDCRLYGVDTPETTKTPTIARKARNRFLQLATNCHVDLDDDHDKLNVNKLLDTMNTQIIFIDCFGGDKYGRELVKLYIDEEKKECINDILITEGYARSYNGGKKESWS